MTPGPGTPGKDLDPAAGGPPPIALGDAGVAAVLGAAPDGPLERPVRVHGSADLEHRFGPARAPLATAVRQYFTNGGRAAWVVRTASSAASDVARGLNALQRDGADFGLLLLAPDTPDADVDPDSWPVALQACRHGRALLLVDPPQAWTDAAAARHGAARLGLADPNAALYWPRLRLRGRAAGGRSAPPSGAVAGTIARTDAASGVWSAPAGPDAGLYGVGGLSATVDASEFDGLAAAGINGLRPLRGYGPVIWGARTRATTPEWRYLPVRRLALAIEKAVTRGLDWAVFEPNGPELWARAEAAVQAFLTGLWRHGAFQGLQTKQAFFVKCDWSTHTRADVAQGRLNLQIGFAPLRPAEFVLLRLGLAVQPGGTAG